MRGMNRPTYAGLVAFLLLLTLVLPLVALAEVDREITAEEQARIDEINERNTRMGYDWIAGPTNVSGLTPEEKARRLGGELPLDVLAEFDALIPDPAIERMTFRSSYDWRDYDGVTSAKDQADCGSCWAFGACSATEAHIRIAEGIILDISEQQIIDCNDQGSDCDGGQAAVAYGIQNSPGSVSEEDIPYVADDNQSCRQRRYDKVAIIDGTGNVSNTVTSLKYAIENYGPLSVSMCVYDDFYNYTSGCYEHAGTDWTNHVVMMLGWDDAMCGGDGAWICKNSWGTDFGEGGFFYIKYGTCRIGSGAMYPLNAHTPKTVLVPDEYASIQVAIDNSDRGDVIKIAEGTYDETIVLDDYRSLIGGYDATFTYRDPEIYPVIINAGGTGHGIYVENSDNILIDGVKVTGATSTSSGIYVKGTTATIQNVEVYGCWRGLTATFGSTSPDGDIIVELSDFHDNTVAGIFLNDVPNAAVRLYYVASYDNGGAGIYSYSSATTIENCTIAGNGLEGGIDLISSAGNVIKNNIIASNTGYGIKCTSATPDISYNDVWDNSSGGYSGCSAGTGDVSVDPIFCDAAGGVYSVHATSPTLTVGAAGVPMGSLGIGCPEGPQDLQIAQSGASLVLSWNQPPAKADVDYYIVYRDTVAIPAAQVAIVNAPDTAFIDVTIPPCEFNYYRVSAVDLGGLEGAPSNKVFGELCYAGPADLAVTFSEGANELSWTTGAGSIDHYIINRGNKIAEPESLSTVSSGETDFVDIWTSGCPRDNYSYEIEPVYDTSWHGQPSAEVSIDPSPSPPGGVNIEWSVDDIVLTWDWSCESDFGRFWVYRDTIPFSDPVSSDRLVGFTPDTTHVDEGMNPGKTWFYRLAASDEESQKSVYSEMVWLGTGQVLPVPSPYATIQAAIDAAGAIDTVLVAAGTYSENINLKDGVLVMSSDGAATTSIQSSSGSVVSATGLGDLTLLKGFTVDGQGTATSGMQIMDSVVRVQNCVLTGCTSGAAFSFGAKPTFIGTEFTLCERGVTLSDSSAPFFAGCTFSDNSFTGVYNQSDPGPQVGRTLADACDFIDNAYFHIFNAAAVELDAEYNYWGDLCVEETWFYGLVDYIPWTDAAHLEIYTECPNSVPDEGAPEKAFVTHNFPNPFNPSTAIRYAIKQPGPVALTIYDLSGRVVRSLVSEEQGAGTYTVVWQGRDDQGRQLGSGVYFYKLDGPGVSERRKMVMLK
ncbi:right-handed parallel beta-helix repeat-containing protein [bacterium]|nr:right-handed parallel beta-helix repeat-containing protein [bacterium]